MTAVDDARAGLMRAAARYQRLCDQPAAEQDPAALNLARFTVDHAAVMLSLELAAENLAARIVPPPT